MDEIPKGASEWFQAFLGGCFAIIILTGPIYIDWKYIGGDGWFGGLVIGQVLMFGILKWMGGEEGSDDAREFLLFPFGKRR